MQPWLTSWLYPHEEPWDRTSQLSCTQILDHRNYEINVYFFNLLIWGGWGIALSRSAGIKTFLWYLAELVDHVGWVSIEIHSFLLVIGINYLVIYHRFCQTKKQEKKTKYACSGMLFCLHGSLLQIIYKGIN